MKKDRFSFKRMIEGAGLSIEEVAETASFLHTSGKTKEESAEIIASLIDDLIDFKIVVPGPLGVVAESIDYMVIKAGVMLLLSIKASGKNKSRAKPSHREFVR